MINSFFSAQGAAQAKAQIKALTISGVFAFFWDASNYLLEWPAWCLASPDGCSAYRWKINWTINLVGAGMIVPTAVNASMVSGTTCTADHNVYCMLTGWAASSDSSLKNHARHNIML